jgi:hypothetical protein
MNIIQIIKKWFSRFSKKTPQPLGSEIIMENLLNKLVLTDENEISCDDVHELLDEFTELKISGEDVKNLMPLVHQHLQLCADCLEEHDLLLQALEIEQGLNEN